MCSKRISPRRRRGWIFLTLPAIVGATFLLVHLHKAHLRDLETATLTYPPAAASPSAWDRGLDEFLADEYPSRRQAVAALARKAGPLLVQSAGDPEDVVLLAGDGDADPLANQIRQLFPSASVRRGGPAEETQSRSGGATIVRLKERGSHANEASDGTLELRVDGPHGSHLAHTRYIPRPWLEDFSGYISENPDRRLMIVRSDDRRATLLNVGEAQQSAREAAAEALAPIVSEEVMKQGFSPIPTNRALADVRAHLDSSGVIQDRFVQRFARPYGDIWRETLLIDASPERLAPMVESLAASSQHLQRKTRTTFASVVIVLAAIFGAYLVLNTLTRSYFTGRLRAAAILFAAIAIFIAGLLVKA